MTTCTKTLLATTLAAVALIATPAYSAVVLLEDFNDVGTTTWADIGWTGVNNAGGTITGKSQTNHVSFPFGPYMDPNGAVEGNGRLWGHFGTAWFVTDAPALSAIDQIRWLDRDQGRNYRVGLEVGGQWYLSDLLSTSSGGGFDPGDGAHPGVTLTDFSSGFSLWGVGTASTGSPADDAEAWDLSTLGSSRCVAGGHYHTDRLDERQHRHARRLLRSQRHACSGAFLLRPPQPRGWNALPAPPQEIVRDFSPFPIEQKGQTSILYPAKRDKLN
jgi:hypothetical protein